MSGAEAGAALGLISSLITIIATAKDLYEAANNANGLPEVLSQVAAKIPLILIILKRTKEYAQKPDLDSQTCEAIRKILEPGEKRAQKLLGILKEVMPKDGASTFDRYKSATKGQMKSGRVENLIKAILEDMNLLSAYFSFPKDTKMALKTALEEVQHPPDNVAREENRETLKEIKYSTHRSCKFHFLYD